MIDWDRTREIYGISSVVGYRPKVCVVCDGCGRDGHITIRSKSKVKDNQIKWYCPSCVGRREDVSKKLSKSTSRQWANSDYRKTVTSKSVSLWSDPTYRERHKCGMASGGGLDNHVTNSISNAVKERWKDIEYRNKILLSRESASNKLSKLRSTDEYREKMAIVRANMPSVSSLQDILYSILDDLGIKYYREYPDEPSDPQCIVGPWNFDCVIPREGKPALLIECQGEYWHSIPKVSQSDKSKSSYIINNLSDKYEIKYLWEHEFKCPNRIKETIKYWLGLGKLEIMDFDFEDIIIKDSQSKDYRLLLSKYHYLANAGRGGLVYGAYLGEELIAVCVFSPPVRQTVAPRLGCEDSGIRELSRLCIHPKYQKKNFASWFVSRCIKQLDPKYRCIVSYCDTTFNHDGAVYKACNFVLDGKIKPDYWYINEDGWVMHKKTLYQHAINLKMKEKEYADKMGYSKIYGKEKLRFVYER